MKGPKGIAPVFQLVVQMRVSDTRDAAIQLADHFGFEVENIPLSPRVLARNFDGVRMRRLNQVIELVFDRAGGPAGHGPIDHFAIQTSNVDNAVVELKSKSGQLDLEVTPDGPIDLPEFWAAGVRVAFAKGPEGGRLEYCQHMETSETEADGSHDHVGIFCRDLDESATFYADYGFRIVADFSISSPDGSVDVRFVRRNNYSIELISTPQSRKGNTTFSAYPVWAKLIFETSTPLGVTTSRTGPSGEIVEVRQLEDLLEASRANVR